MEICVWERRGFLKDRFFFINLWKTFGTIFQIKNNLRWKTKPKIIDKAFV
jgi:hypothetical protein